MKLPRISVITVCKNSEDTIDKTIQSVVCQTYQNTEYIVVDGKSTDNTLSIINSYTARIAALLSEEDNGLYEAMHKGIAVATGDFIIFMNSGDRFFNENAIGHVVNFIKDLNSDSIDVYHGSVLVFDYQNGNGFVWKSGPISHMFIHREAQPHAATFYTRAALTKNGLFDLSYRICADYEWTIRAYKTNGLRFQYMPILVAVYAKGGISNNREFAQLRQMEDRRALMTHFTRTEDVYFRIRKRLRRMRKRVGLCLTK